MAPHANASVEYSASLCKPQQPALPAPALAPPARRQTEPIWLPKLDDRSPIAVELCSGMGGIGIGLRSLGFRVARAYDAWDTAVGIYNHNAAEKVARSCDLLTPQGRRLVLADCRELGDIDLLAAGPPCKGFSQIRNGHHHKATASQHNRVLHAIPEYVAALRPRMVLIENVPDLARHNKGRTLRELLSKLAEPGPRALRYHVEYKVYDAALAGTPQARRRILLLGVRVGSKAASLPDAGPDLGPLFAAIRHGREKPAALQEYLSLLEDPSSLVLTTASQALSDIPPLGAGARAPAGEYASPPQAEFQRLMRDGAPSQLSDMRTPAVRAETIERLALIKPGGCARDIPPHQLNGLSRRFDSAYRRLHPDAPSTALSTKYDCVYHYAHARSLSVREYARIQGLPDFVAFPEKLASRRSAYELIGNSVPPLLIRAVMSAVLHGGKPLQWRT